MSMPSNNRPDTKNSSATPGPQPHFIKGGESAQGSPVLISGNANRPLAEGINSIIRETLTSQNGLIDARVERFSDGEIFVEVHDNVRQQDMFVIQPISSPANDNLMELLVMIDALRRSSARRITAVIPYFGYARQDRRTKARTPISAKLVANLLTIAGVDRIMTMDLHAAQIQGFFDIPVDNLYASPIFALDIRANFPDLSKVTIVSPDVGGVARARELIERLDTELAIVDKRRSAPGEIAEMNVIGDVAGRDCILLDDICDTAGTLCKAADVLAKEGARSVHAYISHGVLSGAALERINASALGSLVITDSINQGDKLQDCTKIRQVSTGPLLAHAIMNTASGSSVSSLFKTRNMEVLYRESYPDLSKTA